LRRKTSLSGNYQYFDCAQFCDPFEWNTLDSSDTLDILDTLETLKKQENKGIEWNTLDSSDTLDILDTLETLKKQENKGNQPPSRVYGK
jgi:hypothetical protein